MIFLPRTTHKFDFFCWQIEQIVFQTFDKSNFKVHWTPGWNIEKVHNMKSLPNSVFEKFAISVVEMVDGGGGGSIKAAPDVTDLKRYVSSCPLAQSGPRVENGKRKKRTWMGR